MWYPRNWLFFLPLCSQKMSSIFSWVSGQQEKKKKRLGLILKEEFHSYILLLRKILKVSLSWLQTLHVSMPVTPAMQDPPRKWNSDLLACGGVWLSQRESRTLSEALPVMKVSLLFMQVVSAQHTQLSPEKWLVSHQLSAARAGGTRTCLVTPILLHHLNNFCLGDFPCSPQ